MVIHSRVLPLHLLLLQQSKILEGGKSIQTEQVASTEFLLIYISNPDYYLDKVKGFKRKLMQGNNKMYGTPLSITSNTLKYNFNDLVRLLNDKLNEQREGMPNR